MPFDYNRFKIQRDRVRKIISQWPDFDNEKILKAYRLLYPYDRSTSETITRRIREIRQEMRSGQTKTETRQPSLL